MSAEDAKRALKACEDGIALLTAQQKANQALVDDYNKNLTAWQARKNTADDKWTRENSDRIKAQEQWDANVNAKAEQKRNDSSNWNNCVVWNETSAGKHDDWCRNDKGDSGWYHAGQDGAGCAWGWGKGVCKKNDDLRLREAKSELGPRPANYQEPKFSETKPTESAQNQTAINVACCANTLNVVGSQVTDSNIQQQNDCAKDLKAKAAGTPPPPAGTPPPPPAGTPPAGTSNVVKSTSTPVSSAKPNRRMLMVIVLVIISLILSSCSSGLFLLI